MSFSTNFKHQLKTRVEAKSERIASAKKAERECYAQVDRRDGESCRVCFRRVGGLSMVTAREHHHLIPRSQGGAHETANVLSLCRTCHHAEHASEIRLSGDADQRSSVGMLNGVKFERNEESGWKVAGWR